MKSFLFICFVLIGLTAQGQMWYDDASGGGFPILSGNPIDSLSNKLFNARFNTADGSATVSFFNRTLPKQPRIDTSEARPSGTERPDPNSFSRDNRRFGWGTSLKGKVENGLGNFFSSGKTSPSFTIGSYLAYSGWNKAASGSKFSLALLSFRYTRGQQRFYYPEEKADSIRFSDFLSTDGFDVSTGYYEMVPNGSHNTLWGIALSSKNKDNYSTLTKVEAKNAQMTNGATQPGRTVTTVDDDGYIYAQSTAKDPYNKFWAWRLQAHYGKVFSNSRIAFITYPSVEFTTKHGSSGTINLGFGLHFLKENQPTLSQVGVLFEFSDLFNSNSSTKPLLQRGFKVGIVIGLNAIVNAK